VTGVTALAEPFAATAGAPFAAADDAAGRTQSIALAGDFGRAAARAAAPRARISLLSAPSAGGTGVPSCWVSLDAGDPVSTPAGMRPEADGFAGRRGGAFVTGCASAAVEARTQNAAASAARATDDGFTIDSRDTMRVCSSRAVGERRRQPVCCSGASGAAAARHLAR